MPVVKIKNYHTNRYLDCQSETWSTLTAIPAQQVVTMPSDDSISQRWYIESYSGNIYIRTCLDSNFCITRFENAVTHQCGITNAEYYNNMSNNPYAPEIVLEPVYSGHYRIKLVGSDMYLTALTYPSDTPYASWGGYSDVGETMNRQIWLVQTVTDYDCTTLVMPQNMNQKYTEHSTEFQKWGCFCCSAGDIGAFYRGSKYTYAEMLSAGVFTETNIYCQYSKITYCTFSQKTSSFLANIKSSLDSNAPLIVTFEHSIDEHRVVAYGYVGSCASCSDVLVMDPVGVDPSIDMGTYKTLQGVMNEYKNSMVTEVYTSQAKNSST